MRLLPDHTALHKAKPGQKEYATHPPAPATWSNPRQSHGRLPYSESIQTNELENHRKSRNSSAVTLCCSKNSSNKCTWIGILMAELWFIHWLWVYHPSCFTGIFGRFTWCSWSWAATGSGALIDKSDRLRPCTGGCLLRSCNRKHLTRMNLCDSVTLIPSVCISMNLNKFCKHLLSN